MFRNLAWMHVYDLLIVLLLRKAHGTILQQLSSVDIIFKFKTLNFGFINRKTICVLNNHIHDLLATNEKNKDLILQTFIPIYNIKNVEIDKLNQLSSCLATFPILEDITQVVVRLEAFPPKEEERIIYHIPYFKLLSTNIVKHVGSLRKPPVKIYDF
ncbi:hypothetical protein ACJX0J_040731 [Zea mays]